MFTAQYDFPDPEVPAWLALPDSASRVFLQTLLHCTQERTHPHWALRPLNISTLSELWPGERDPRNKKDSWRSLRGAIEDEFLSRAQQKSPDTTGLSLDSHTHTDEQRRSGGCSTCGNALRTLRSSPVSTKPINDMVAKLRASTDVAAAVPAASVYASELIARGTPLRQVHQMAKKFLLDPGRLQAGSLEAFWDRVHALINPKPEASKPAEACELLRSLHFRKPGHFAIGFPISGLQETELVLQEAEELDHVESDGSEALASAEGGTIESKAKKVVAQRMKDVAGAPAAREAAIEGFRGTTELWLAYLRLAIGDARNHRRRVLAEGDVRVIQSGRRIVLPALEHRRFWSQTDSGRAMSALIGARLQYREDDQVQLDAATQWAGLAFIIWPEAPIRAAGLIWMALEALYGGPGDVLETGTARYLNRLPVELAWEVRRYVDRVLHKKRVTSTPPAWASTVGLPSMDQPIRKWLEKARGNVRAEDDGIALRIEEVLGIYDTSKRALLIPYYERDLRLLYAVRNGIAHRGHFQVAPALAVYLFNLGIEVLKAGISDVIATAKDSRPGTKQGQLTLEAAWERTYGGAAEETSSQSYSGPG